MAESNPQLLATLLALPRADARLIERERLIAKLDGAAAFRVIHLRAPAGFGKSSLLASWVHTPCDPARRVAWVSLTETHNDPRSLLRYVVAALRTAAGAIGEATLTLLNSNVPMNPAALVTTLINELGGLTADIHLVLDDCHHITNEQTLDTLRLLLEHAPATLRFVLTSREALGVPVGRLRQLGQLYEFSPRDLEFTADEVSRFAAREQLDLGPPALATLARKTGGWAAGLRLAAISMRDEQVHETFIESLTGGHMAVAAFLREDVLARQPPALQQFLLCSGLLDELTAPMCDEVLERNDSAAMLDMAQQRGLFLFPVDPAGERFRYHGMFADFLRQRLRRDDPDLALDICRRASAWCARHESPSQTIEYALRAGDSVGAGRYLETYSEQIFASGQLDALQNLAARLPEDVQEQCPRLQLDLIWIDTLRWEIRDAQRRLRQVKQFVAAQESAGGVSPALHEKVLHRELMVALLRDDFHAAESLWARWPLVTTGDNDYFDGSAETADLLPRRERFECEFVLAQVPRVRRKYTSVDAEFGTVWFDSIVGPACLAHGEPGRAQAVLRGAIETAIRISGAESPLVAMPSLLLADVLYEENDTVAAAALVDGWLPQADRIGFVDQLIAGFICAARLARLRNDHAVARALLDQGDEIATEYDFQRLAVHVLGERVRQLLADNQLDEARDRIAASTAMHARVLAPPGRLACTVDAVATVILARVAFAGTDPAAAMRVLRTWINYVEGRSCLRDAMRLRAILAAMLAAGGEMRDAWRVLRPAVALVAQTGLLRPLLDAGDVVIAVLEHARDSGGLAGDTMDELVRRLCASNTDNAGMRVAPAAAQRAATGDEVLTRRQREILACVADGSSNKEIAARLGLTEATVKWHLQQVYERLGAHRRVAALRRARELGLIE